MIGSQLNKATQDTDLLTAFERIVAWRGPSALSRLGEKSSAECLVSPPFSPHYKVKNCSISIIFALFTVRAMVKGYADHPSMAHLINAEIYI